MQFDFLSMQNLYLSLAREDARPLAKTLSSPPADPSGQPVGHVRPQPRRADAGQAQRCRARGGFRRVRPGRGHADVRPRPAPPAAHHARRRPRPDPDGLFADVLAARNPGALLRRGNRHGRGPAAKGRSAVRSPMQWNDTENGGFSTAPAKDLVAQVVDGYFGPKNVNAAAAKRDPESLWNFMATLIQRYRESPELGWGDFELIKQPAAKVLLHRCTWDGSTVVLAHNFGAEPASVAANVASAGDPEAGVRGRLPAGPAGRRGHRAGGRRRFRAGAGPLRLPLVPGPAPGRTPHPVSRRASALAVMLHAGRRRR